ncbi:MAG: polysaccharide deacetylase family protein [Sphingobacteriia bacterium]|nr:polysaccharide deacetylase family protein [Sphingobacteriia bacterium]
MSVDIEDWFHLLETPLGSDVSGWSHLESRMDEPVRDLIGIIKSCNASATFFVVGWVAKKHPEIVKLIADAGFEVACQSMNHSLISCMNEKEFHEDTRIAIDTIEQVIGKKVISYRAPGFSIKEGMSFVWPVLAELGIERDSSLFLPKSGHGGVTELPSLKPFKIEINGEVIKEYPIVPFVFSGAQIPFSGGGYFRLWPYIALNYFTKSSDYMMAYIHPRDIDFKQPMVHDLNLLRKFKSYYGIKSARNKFAGWLSDFYFCDLNEFDSKYDWEAAQSFNYLDLF